MPRVETAIPAEAGSRRRLTPTVDGAHVLLLHDRMLGERLYIYSLARFTVVAGMVVGTLFARHAVGVEGLNVGGLLGVAAILFLYNCLVFNRVRLSRSADLLDGTSHALEGILHVTIVIDFLFLTVALWLVGGAQSPFQAFYLFNVIIASVLLSRAAAFVHASVGYVFLAGLVVGEWSGALPVNRPVGAVSGAEGLDGRYAITLLAVYGMLFILSALTLTSLMELVRAGERTIRKTNEQLQYLSDLRRDFLHVALHDLKAPVGAVSMQLSALESQAPGALTDQQRQIIDRCQARLREQGAFLHDLEILASLDTKDLAAEMRPLDLGDMIRATAEELHDAIAARGHTVTFEVAPNLGPVRGIPRLIREVIANLLTNAAKYTPPGGRIEVHAANTPGGVQIQVRDNGIGITVEDQRRLFREFSRIRTQREDVDQSSSSGLGLSIVRRIVAIHGGQVTVTSTPAEGSTFSVDLPAAGSHEPAQERYRT